MRFSQMYIPTFKEDPADAQVVSHKLMLRAGYINKVAAGIYNYLPLGVRVLQKISQIVREEMNAAGAQEIGMPMVQPKELWEESGRWFQYGTELLRFKDRKDADFCLGPTHEEIVTALVRDYVKSYRHLPINLYQIQTKFRDEVRPRFGLMRGREFLMKDAYSFDENEEKAILSYEAMKACYERIFSRCGLQFCAVEADTGSIGGSRSHEFQVVTPTGEDSLVRCGACGYSANVELAAIFPSHFLTESQEGELEKVHTPNCRTIEEVATFLKQPIQQAMKTVMLMVDNQPVMALCRGDHTVNEIKVRKALKGANCRMMTDEEVKEFAGPPGFLGPIHAKPGLRIIGDQALNGAVALSTGANESDKHYINVSLMRDCPMELLDIREAAHQDPCGKCGQPMELTKGIEVGHVFYLGTKYSRSMKAVFLNATGQEQCIEMGCYGIGVSRTAAAAIEQNHDERGIIWPMPIAPFQVSLVRIGKDESEVLAADKIYQALIHQNIEVLYDDREERPGVKFAEADLIGCPLRITVGGKSLKEGLVEVKKRKEPGKEPEKIPLDAAISWAVSAVASA